MTPHIIIILKSYIMIVSDVVQQLIQWHILASMCASVNGTYSRRQIFLLLVIPLFGMFDAKRCDIIAIPWESMLRFLKLCFSLVGMLNDGNSSNVISNDGVLYVLYVLCVT